MNKFVSIFIFGGIGTKQCHYKHAIEVYKSNGYTTNFYANKDLLVCVIPKRYANNVNYAYANDTTGTIIHTNSGGFWTGLDYLSKTTNNKLFICDAGLLLEYIKKRNTKISRYFTTAVRPNRETIELYVI